MLQAWVSFHTVLKSVNGIICASCQIFNLHLNTVYYYVCTLMPHDHSNTMCACGGSYTSVVVLYVYQAASHVHHVVVTYTVEPLCYGHLGTTHEHSNYQGVLINTFHCTAMYIVFVLLKISSSKISIVYKV